MRILFLSFYYKPDLCAGSFRATALAEALSKKIGKADELHVLTTRPNRYRSYNVSTLDQEKRDNLGIRPIAAGCWISPLRS